MGQDRPNIVLVLFDDLGWGQPQCYDAASTLPTPQLNLLATQGMRFTDAHSAAAVCTPTRYGILTGRYPCRIGQFGVLGTWSPPILPTTRLTLPSLLQQGGYDTACIGKWHLGLQWKERGKEIPEIGTRFREGPNELGFDYFCGYTHAAGIEAVLEQDRVISHISKVESQPLMTRKAVEWLEQRDATRPFFLYFPMCPPHYPVAPSAEFVGKSGGVDIAGKDLQGQADPKRYPDWLYQGDAMLGALLKVLEQRGLADNTIVIATSDNGAEHRSYPPLRESKRSIYEGGHRVPLVVRWPKKIKPGSVWNHPVCLTDLMATVAPLAKQSLPANAGEDSVSFLPALLGQTADSTRDAIVHQSMAGDLAIRSDAWKLICFKNGRRELYNLKEDLSESKDRLKEFPEIEQRLAAMLQKCLEEGRSTPGVRQVNEYEITVPKMKDSEKRKR
ncbi:MAG: arylsulfatase [Pirellulales bacterium]